jgi:chromosome partitioning protein
MMRLAHSMADTLITPLNDSFVDFDVLGTVDPTLFDCRGQPLCRNGARGAPAAPPGRRRPDRLGCGAQPAFDAWARATSGWSARGVEALAKQLGFRAICRWLCRTRRLPRVLPARPDRARRINEDTLGIRPTEPRTRPLATRSKALIDSAEAADRRARQAARRGPRRMGRAADKPLDTHDLLAD